MLRSDMHCHSSFSPDGHNTVDEIALSSAGNADFLAITDHWDYMQTTPFINDWRFAKKSCCESAETIRDEILAAKAKYADKIKLLYGVELGQPYMKPDEARRFISEMGFDFVLGSVHFMRNDRDPYAMTFTSAEEVRAACTEYLDTLTETAALGLSDSIAHIDYPLRYMPEEFTGYSYEGFEEKLKRLFSVMIEKDTCFELNTSHAQRKLGRISPEPWVIELYVSCGGKYVTIGSDAHRTSDIALLHDEAAAMAKSCGITGVAWFENRERRIIEL